MMLLVLCPILEPWQYRQHVVLKYHIRIKQITNNLTGQTVNRIPVFEFRIVFGTITI